MHTTYSTGEKKVTETERNSTMEMEEKGEKQQQGQGQNENKGKKTIIEIPSYDQVVQNSQPKSTPLFTSTPSFSQAIAFIKNSEFYTPPPRHLLSLPPKKLGTHIDRLEAPTSSASAAQVHASSSSPNSGQTRNAILVSHRQSSVPSPSSRLPILPYQGIAEKLLTSYRFMPCGCGGRSKTFIRGYKNSYASRLHSAMRLEIKVVVVYGSNAFLRKLQNLLEECGRYLETIKVYENKPADLIQGQMDIDYISRLSHCLTAIRHVNKTDVVTLGSTFGSLSHIMDASMEDLAHCPGIGERKVKRLYDAFYESFKRVVPSHPPATESSVQNSAKLPVDDEVPEVVKEAGNSSKRAKKEPDMTVKSALSAAFARYSSKIGRKNDKSSGEKSEGSIAGEEENAERI